MRHPSRAVVPVLLVAAACSGTDPVDAGTFQARLSGAASLSLTGTAHAGIVYTEESPDGQFTISMFRSEGGVTRSISIACSGQSAPAPGSYPLSLGSEGCVGRYSRFTLDPLATLEQVTSSTGTLRLDLSDRDAAAGTFNFSGVLVQGGDSVGRVQASGSFNATASP